MFCRYSGEAISRRFINSKEHNEIERNNPIALKISGSHFAPRSLNARKCAKGYSRKEPMTLTERIRAFAYGARFESFIITVIILNALIIGVETYVQSPMLKIADKVCVGIFLLEIALKFIGRRSSKEYFTDGWNWFDIIVVAGVFIPATNGVSTALRILRVFRVLRLIHFVSELRLITGVLLKSLRSMAFIGVLLVIVAYIYAVIGVELFGKYMPEYATLHESFFSLFRSLTAEDWTDLRYEGLEHGNYWVVTIYHVSWIIVGTFVMINLVVGAILNNYNEVQEAERKRYEERAGIQNPTNDEERLRELIAEMQTILEKRRGNPGV